jgi:hypothetical protein
VHFSSDADSFLSASLSLVSITHRHSLSLNHASLAANMSDSPPAKTSNTGKEEFNDIPAMKKADK